MPLSDGTKAIGPAWASAATADRTAPDDSALTPPLVIADGWPDSFSTAGGNTPRRPVFNELFYRQDSAILDWLNYGIPPWDTDVDTLAGGVKQVNGVIYRALVDNGPTYSNATDPTAAGQTVWEIVSGTLNVPDAPAAPTAVSTNGELDWSWNCPKDNGAAVTSFDFQWRVSGQTAWTDVANLTHARYLLTGLTNGTDYEARVRATNTIGDSLYGSEGMGTPVAAVPGGGSTFALRADTGDASGEIDLDWLAPDDNGAPITQYRYQWKSGGQNYSGGRSGTSTATSATVSSLTDGTEYDFRVRATNSVGNGPNSNEASATPADPVVPPTDTVPGLPTSHTGTPRRPLAIDWVWEVPNDNGGQRIESYDHQWRYSGNNWSGNIATTESTYRRIAVADATNNVQARVRARNSVGVSGWAGTVTVNASALIGLPTQRHRFTTSQTWNWPYADLDRAVAVITGLTDTPRTMGFQTSLDIPLGTGVWEGAVSDGTTIWFIDNTSDTAQAYVAATQARDSGRDISIGSGDWRGGASDGTTLWFIRNGSASAPAYVAATQARDSGRDISLGQGNWAGATSDGTTIWVVLSTFPTAQAYVAATQARDSGKDVTLSGTNFQGAASDGTTLWFIDDTGDRAQAYVAATQARDSGRDISLGSGSTRGASDGTTIWFVDNTGDTAVAYNTRDINNNTSVVTGGTTYTTEGDDDGYVIPSLTGIADNAPFVITIGPQGMVDIYPQT